MKPLITSITLPFLTAVLAVRADRLPAETAKIDVTVHAQPLNAGRIDPKVFGNFIELLDDVTPGMWAELLNDRSFEGIVPAANWCYYDGSLDICDRSWDTNATWSYSTENSFNGTRCAKITAGSQPGSLTQSGLGVRKGMLYDFSAHLRASGEVKAIVLLKFLLPTGEWMTLASAELPPLSAQWQKYSVKMTSLGKTEQAVFELRVEGTGNLWADKLSLMPEDNLKGWRRDVVEAINEVKPSVIRWGGSSVDPGHYRWKDGIGDRDLRNPWLNENWGRMDPNDVGIDEFCQFCELTTSEALVCISFADGPQSAADLVEYCNGDPATTWGAKRAANGHPGAYQVKYWQVGNEISGNNPGYLNQIAEFIAAMKKADPKVQIMTSFPSQRLLDRIGKNIAFVCPHHYTTDLVECDRDFDRIGQMLEHTPGCANIKIAVTEWNIDAGSWGLGRGKQATLEAALLNARYLNLMLRHSDKVKLACRSNLANSYCGAIIETGICGSGVLRRPSFYAMKLYSQYAKPIPLWLEQFNDRLDLMACGSEDRKSAVVFAVNLKPEPVELSVAFADFPTRAHVAEAQALCDTLQAGQPDVINHWNSPDRLMIVKVPATHDTLSLPGLSAAAIVCETN
jgi:alpha-N-arabinofuranosidase